MPNIEGGRSAKENKLILKFWKGSELILLGSMFGLGILILLIHLLAWVVPTWRETSRYARGICLVENVNIHSLVDRDGNVGYRPEILIRYNDRRGKTYHRRAYDKTTLTETEGFVFDQAQATEAVRRFQIGESRPCRYLPEDPMQVILKWDPVFWGWIFLAVPVSLAAFGLTGLFWLAKKRSVSREKFALPLKNRERFPTVPASGEINESPGTDLAYRLPMFFSPIWQNLVGLSLSLVWNVIAICTFVFVFSVRTDHLDLVLAILFGIVFCGTGITGFIWFFKKTFQVLLTGTTILEISDHPVTPDRKYRLALRQNGSISASSYNINLICTEIARYRQGTDTLTNRKVVLSLPLFSRTNFQIPQGETFRDEFFMKVPAGAMHSLHTVSNEIQWKISVEIIKRKGRTLRREYPVIVLPYSNRD